MTPWRTISVALRGDVSSLVAATTTGSAAVRKFGADSEASLNKVEGATKRTGSTWTTLTKAMAVGIAGVTIALGFSLREAISWESAFAGVSKTVDGTTAQLAELEDGLLDLAKRLPSTREEIAGVAEAAGALGIERDNILSFTETMIGLGEATNLTADEAATMLAQFANIMGTPQAAVESLADALVYLGNNGASTEREILDMALRLAGAGATIGLTEDQVFALANALASMGVPAELGGSAVSQVLGKMQVAVAEGSDAVRAFADVAGLSADDFVAAWQSDPGAAFEGFIGSLAKLQDEGANVIGILADLGIKGIRERDVVLRMVSGHEQLAKSMDDVNDSAGALAEEVDKRYETAESRLRVFANQVTDIARVVGAALIPSLLAALDAAEAFGRWLADVGALAAQRLEGAWDSLQATGRNLADLLADLRQLGLAVADSWVGTLAGAAVLGTLTAIAQVLETTTGLLADHEEIIVAIGVAYAGWKVAGILKAAAVAFDGLAIAAYNAAGAMAATTWASNLKLIGSGAKLAATNLLAVPEATQRLSTGLSAGLSQVRSGMNGLAASIGPVNGALIGLTVGAAAATYALDRLHDSGKRDASEWLSGLEDVDTTRFNSIVDRTSVLLEEQNRLQREIAKGGTNYFDDEKLAAQSLAISDALEEQNRTAQRVATGMANFRQQTKLTVRQVEDLAKVAGVDLPEAFDENGDAVPALVKEYERLVDVSEEWGITVSDAAQKSQGELQLIEESIQRIDEAGKATGEAWSAWADLLQITDNPVDQDAVRNSEKILADAKERVADAEAEARAQGQTAEDAKRSADALGDARDALREATEAHADLLASDSPLNAEKVQKWYQDRLVEAATFTANLNEAIAAGYDPAIVTKLMQAGPEAAGPVLEALLEDTSAAYVESINNAEEALTNFTTFAIRQSQLTQRAIELGTRQSAEDLATAIAIEQQAMANPALTGNEIADRLGISLADAKRVVDEFDLSVEVYTDPEQARLQLRDFTNEERNILMGVEVDTDPADEELDGFTNEQREALIGVEADTEDAETEIDRAARDRTVKIVAITDPATQRIIDGLSLGATLAANSNRWGGITSYATGGIRNAMIGTGRGLTHWDEPATGGEAYVPRRGNRWRSLGVLDEAASWYGMALTPKQVNQLPPRPVPYSGALVPSGGGRGGPVVDTVNVYEATSAQVTAGAVQTALGLFG